MTREKGPNGIKEITVADIRLSHTSSFARSAPQDIIIYPTVHADLSRPGKILSIL